jgi:hypothetical protein
MTILLTQIDYFRREAKRLLRQVRAGDAEALARLHQVECGFSKWEDLIKASALELQAAIAMKKVGRPYSNLQPKRAGSPLGNLFRGPGGFPMPPNLTALADMFDKTTLREQERLLDENARAMGLFDRR